MNGKHMVLALLLSACVAPTWTMAQQKVLTDAEAAQRSAALDHILAAEVPLGSDAWRAERLAQSHRRHETAKMIVAGRPRAAFVAYPEVTGRVAVVMVLPEDQGVNNWARDIADQIATMGYIAVVPDFLAGYGPKQGGRESFSDAKSAMMALGALTDESMLSDLNSWADYAKQLPQSNGVLEVAGFGYGGGRAFDFASRRRDLSATYVFYDWSPPGTVFANITAPVYGFYAEHDPRVMKSLDATKAGMAQAGKTFEAVTYAGSDHMFVRLGEETGNSNPANPLARALAMARFQALLDKVSSATPAR